MSRKLVPSCSQYMNADPTIRMTNTRFTRRDKVSLRRMVARTLAMAVSTCRVLTYAVFQSGGLASASNASNVCKDDLICDVSFSKSCSSKSKSPPAAGESWSPFINDGSGTFGAFGSLRSSEEERVDLSSFAVLTSEKEVSPDEEQELLPVEMPMAGTAPAPKAASSSSPSS